MVKACQVSECNVFFLVFYDLLNKNTWYIITIFKRSLGPLLFLRLHGNTCLSA